MDSNITSSAYSPKEELANALTHGLGAVLSVLATGLLLLKGSAVLTTAQMSGLLVYGLSMMILFSASTIYHSVQTPSARVLLKQMDHSAIYLLIAGTYTPFLIITLHGNTTAHIMLWILWGLAAIGIIFKLFYVGRFQKVSLITYLLMGWLSLILIKDIYHAIDHAGLVLLIAGGLSYTIGTLFYAAKRYAYTHAIWHLFVLGGAACHFLSIYWYVLPR
jgi:hemolysin III